MLPPNFFTVAIYILSHHLSFVRWYCLLASISKHSRIARSVIFRTPSITHYRRSYRYRAFYYPSNTSALSFLTVTDRAWRVSVSTYLLFANRVSGTSSRNSANGKWYSTVNMSAYPPKPLLPPFAPTVNALPALNLLRYIHGDPNLRSNLSESPVE